MDARLDNLEERLGRLEEFARDAKQLLAKIELRLEQTATRTDIAEIRADMHTSADIARWMIATVVGLFLGFGGLFFVMNNASKSAAPAAASPPIVIYPQPAAPPPVVTPP